jgi:DNA-directed RNA polymerase subunit RPC12/RpoP
MSWYLVVPLSPAISRELPLFPFVPRTYSPAGKTAAKVFRLTNSSWWWKIAVTTMNTKLGKPKKSEPNPARRNLKLPSGTVLLATPNDPGKNDYKCARCGWEWPARKKGSLPARCPHCFSPSWNKTRVKAAMNGPQCHCQFCGWDWTAVKNKGLPAQCPHCNRYDWNGKTALPSAKPPGLK